MLDDSDDGPSSTDDLWLKWKIGIVYCKRNFIPNQVEKYKAGNAIDYENYHTFEKIGGRDAQEKA